MDPTDDLSLRGDAANEDFEDRWLVRVVAAVDANDLELPCFVLADAGVSNDLTAGRAASLCAVAVDDAVLLPTGGGRLSTGEKGCCLSAGVASRGTGRVAGGVRTCFGLSISGLWMAADVARPLPEFGQWGLGATTEGPAPWTPTAPQLPTPPAATALGDVGCGLAQAAVDATRDTRRDAPTSPVGPGRQGVGWRGVGFLGAPGPPLAAPPVAATLEEADRNLEPAAVEAVRAATRDKPCSVPCACRLQFVSALAAARSLPPRGTSGAWGATTSGTFVLTKGRVCIFFAD